MSKLIKELARNKSAYVHMVWCAIAIGLGDVLCAVMDLVWVCGDISVHAMWYHWIVLGGLITANLLIFVSFVWLVKSVYAYVDRHDKKVADRKRTKARISTQATAILKLNTRIDELEAKLLEVKII